MRRAFTVFLACMLLLAFGCEMRSPSYRHPNFSCQLPDGFQSVSNANMVCFAPNGDPVNSSNITFYCTELNWYFDEFSDEEYENLLRAYGSYEDVQFVSKESVRVDGHKAHRVEYRVSINGGLHSLVFYAVSSDMLLFFTLLNIGEDSYVQSFDKMMETIEIYEMQ